MAEGIPVSEQLEKCLEDIDNLLDMCEQERNTRSQPLIETIINNLELGIEVIVQMIPSLYETRNVVNEIAINLQIIRRDWCQGRTGPPESYREIG